MRRDDDLPRPSSHAIGLRGAAEKTHLMLVRPSGGEASVEPQRGRRGGRLPERIAHG
jgi:hypothetical protein